jgi:hypothetical protein
MDRISGHCPWCDCGDTVNLYGCYQCGCCGFIFWSEDHDQWEVKLQTS